jgi:hypothetical protein
VMTVPLSRGLVAIVDDADYDLVLAHGPWYADPSDVTFYARHNRWIGRRCTSVKLHQLLLDAPLVDHVNGDGLDNRRSNLRPASHVENARNRARRSDNRSGFKGVQHRDDGRWRARIQAPTRRIHLGIFPTRIEAAHAYDAAAIELFGEFARLNFPKETNP